jgi:hypothetical protein
MRHFSSSSGYDSFDCPSECHFRRFPPGIRQMIFKDALDDHLNRWLYGNSNLIYFKNVSDDTCAANFCTDSPLQRALKPERILYRELFRLRVGSSHVRIEPDYSIPGNASHYASPRTCSPLLQTSLQNRLLYQVYFLET